MKKYEYVEKMIMNTIQRNELKKNSLLPSESSLMKTYNVSRNVIRQALKNLTDKGLIYSVKGVGTFVKEVHHNTTIIGLITFFPNSYIFPHIIDGIDSILHPKGLSLLIGYSHHDKTREKSLLHQFIQKGVSGIILEAVGDGSPSSSNQHIVEKIIEKNIPVILIDNPMKHINVTSILLNDRISGRESAQYFLNKGHTNFAIFYQKDYYPKVERMEGVKEILEKEGDRVTFSLFPFTGQGKHSSGSLVAKNLISSYNNTHLAIFASSDEDANYIIKEAEIAHLKIQEDISIIGFDNYEPLGITTSHHPSFHMGKIAAREMIDHITSSIQYEPITITLHAKFIERESVKDVTFSV